MAKVAIMTCFMEFNSGYSLTGIVKDQAEMLARYGHDVYILVNEQYPIASTGRQGESSIHIENIVPFTHLIDYKTMRTLSEEHISVSEKTGRMLTGFIYDNKIDMMLTHDILFTGWNLPYAVGVMKSTTLIPWYHWIHSIPCRNSDWWDLRKYGANHTMVYPNATDLDRVATQYRTTLDHCRAIPHIRDMRTMFEFKKETREFIDKFPGLMWADIVQIYPASTDRLAAKRVKEVFNIFKYLKASGKTTFCLIANQWSTGRQRKQDVNDYHLIAKQYGLQRDVDYTFTSEFQNGKYDAGVPMPILRELMQLGNLFIFPTREETFGLVFPEVSLASGALCVMNRSLHCQLETSGLKTLSYDFGSYSNNYIPDHGNWDEYSKVLAWNILDSMQKDIALRTRSFCRQTYNMDALYQAYYRPLVESPGLDPLGQAARVAA